MTDAESTLRAGLRRASGILAGIAVHGLFAWTVWYLYWFLKGELPASGAPSLRKDLALALQFAIPHSLLLYPTIRERLSEWIAPAFYGLFFCAATCVSLLLIVKFWEPSSVVCWQFEGLGRLLIQMAFVGSWVALLGSIRLTGFGYQTGWTPWSHWLRRRPIPRREFKPRGVYLHLRHPVYLSFLGLIWFTPVMTSDRLLLAGTWTVYIFLGSHLKDRRLEYYLGDRYREYQARVPGYPGMPFGPLARIPWNPPAPEIAEVPQVGRRAA